jgi:hypothetical protein
MTIRTRKQRLLAILTTYRQMLGREPTILEAVNWALDEGLYPIPTISDRPDLQAAWEKLFETICDAQGVVSDG